MARVVDTNESDSWKLKVMPSLVDGKNGHCYERLLRQIGGKMKGTY